MCRVELLCHEMTSLRGLPHLAAPCHLLLAATHAIVLSVLSRATLQVLQDRLELPEVGIYGGGARLLVLGGVAAPVWLAVVGVCVIWSHCAAESMCLLYYSVVILSY